MQLHETRTLKLVSVCTSYTSAVQPMFLSIIHQGLDPSGSAWRGLFRLQYILYRISNPGFLV